MTETTPITPKALSELAIFPLPNVVLFPGAVLPLHVFEERYRQLTRDALAGSKLIAMTRIVEPASSATPEVYPIAGVGEIQSARELEDGRFLLLLRGVARVRITDELPTTEGYRRVRAEVLPDTGLEQPELARATAQQLLSLCDQIAETIEDGDELRELVRLGETLGARADLIAAALVQNADTRQSLLEMRDPGARLDVLLEHIAQKMAALGVERHLN